MCLAIAGGRIVISGAKIDSAAEDAAREASIHRTAAAAQSAAQSAAAESLDDQGIACASTSVKVNTGGLSVPVGQVGTVTVTDRGTVVATVELTAADKGVVKIALPALARGVHLLRTSFEGGPGFADSRSVVPVPVLIY